MSREGALWIGGLESYMDEEFVRNSLGLMGEDKVINIKIIKNKITGEHATYGFINFDSDQTALMAMHKLNGKIIPNSTPPVRFKLNHQSTRNAQGGGNAPDYSIWVGDLTPDVDDLQLFKFFQNRFQSIKSAKVVLDQSGYSKGYGFIKFTNEQEQQTALSSMQGVGGLGAKPIRVNRSLATNKGPPILSGTPQANAQLAASIAATVNPQAAAAAAAQAQNGAYGDAASQQYWQNYNYWSQYAAWSQYSQQYYDPNNQNQQQQQAAAANYYAQGQQATDPNKGHKGQAAPNVPTGPSQVPALKSSEKQKVKNKSRNLFEGDMTELVDHREKIDSKELNEEFLAKSEELWDAIDTSYNWNEL